MPQFQKEIIKSMLSDVESYATVLLIILLDTFGTEALYWTPKTIAMELGSSFNVDIPTRNIDKIMAAIAIVTTDDFYKNLPKFIELCNILSGDEFNPLIFNPADADEVAWGMTEALLLYPPDEDEPFTDEIRRYIGKVLAEEGIVNPPDILKVAILEDNHIMADTTDPEMFSQFYTEQASRAAIIEEIIKENLHNLFEQLRILPLVSGSTESLLKNIQRTGVAS